MKLYSDLLTPALLHETLPRGVGLEVVTINRPRKRTHGYTFRLYSAGCVGRFRNSGTYGAENERAASWDDHGHWFASLFKLDPEAVIGYYDGADNFERMTEGKYSAVAIE